MAPLPIATAVVALTWAPAHPTSTPRLSHNGTLTNTISPRADGDKTSPANKPSTSTDPTSQAGIAIGATLGALFFVGLVISLWMLYRFLQRAREAKAKQRRDDRRTRREQEKTEKLRRELEKQQAGYDTKSSSPSNSLRADAILNYPVPAAEVDYTCVTKYGVHYLAKFPFSPLPAVKVPSAGAEGDDYPPQPPSDDGYLPKRPSGGYYYPPRAGGSRVTTDRPGFPPSSRRNSTTVAREVYTFDPEAYRDSPRRPSDDSMRAVISPRLPQDFIVEVSPTIPPTSSNGNGSSGSQSRGRAPGSSTYRAVVSARRPSQGYDLRRSSGDGLYAGCGGSITDARLRGPDAPRTRGAVPPSNSRDPPAPEGFYFGIAPRLPPSHPEDDDYVAKQPPSLGPDGGSGAAGVAQAHGRRTLDYSGNRAVVSTRGPLPPPEEGDYVGKQPTHDPDGGSCGGGANLKDEGKTRYRAVGYKGGPVTPV